MKRYDDRFNFNAEKRKEKSWKNEHKAGGFRCSHCKQFVVINELMGTVNRNHCSLCLWSKHVDEEKGDRRANCNGGMEPVGLTFKHEGFGRIGEIMLIHLCLLCQKISINRTTRDDLEDKIMSVFKQSFTLNKSTKAKLYTEGISMLTEDDSKELHTQLFGNL